MLTVRVRDGRRRRRTYTRVIAAGIRTTDEALVLLSAPTRAQPSARQLVVEKWDYTSVSIVKQRTRRRQASLLEEA